MGVSTSKIYLCPHHVEKMAANAIWLFFALTSNNLEQVIYTHGAQANSAFHPFGVGK